MAENIDSRTRNGFFNILPHEKLSGTLVLDGDKSFLHVWSHKRFSLDSSNTETIFGDLDDNKKVSLINCINVHEFNKFGPGGISQHYKFFPHYAIVGTRHYSREDNFISRITFQFEDASTLFHDRNAFGAFQSEDEQLKEFLSSHVGSRLLDFGSSPIIAYFTGKHKIFSVDTIIGQVSAFNATSYSTMGGPKGASIENTICIEIEFYTPISVPQMDSRVRILLRFFELVIGRPQNLIEINIIQDTDRIPETSSAYINMYPRYDRRKGDRIPDYGTTLVHAVSDQQHFCAILSAWLERDEDWLPARLRFSAGWKQQHHYDPNRVIGAANMFDLLPTSVFPVPTPFSSELSSAIEECKIRFRQLPHTDERNIVLQSLGNIKRHSLKQKIGYRLSVLSDAIGGLIPEIETVTNAAVDYRNLCVHGNGSERTRSVLPKFQGFLTDTLEFVFCASDLIECGWDIADWCKKAQIPRHPFSYYLRDYNTNISKFLKAIRKQSNNLS